MEKTILTKTASDASTPVLTPKKDVFTRLWEKEMAERDAYMRKLAEERRLRSLKPAVKAKNVKKFSEMEVFKVGYNEATLPEMTEEQHEEAEAEFIEAQDERDEQVAGMTKAKARKAFPEIDPYPIWEEVAKKYGVRNPMDVPVAEERLDMTMARRLAIRERYKKHREEGRRVALSGERMISSA